MHLSAELALIDPDLFRAIVPLILATIGWYLAARVASVAVGKTAVAYNLPLFSLVVLAAIRGQGAIVVNTPFSASITALTLVFGLALLHAPIAIERGPRLWALLLPATLLLVLIGFGSRFQWSHVGLLLLEGGALFLLSNQERSEAGQKRTQRVSLLLFAAAIATAGVASWLGIGAISGMSTRLEQPGNGLMSTLLLGPAVVFPLIGLASAPEAETRQTLHLLVTGVMLNLLLILPVGLALIISRPQWVAVFSPPAMATTLPSTAPTTQAVAETMDAVSFPLSVWRIDSVLLLTAALLILPVAMGRLPLRRGEAVALLFGFTLYLMVAVAFR